MYEKILLVLIGAGATAILQLIRRAFGWKSQLTSLDKDTNYLDRHLSEMEEALDRIENKNVSERMCEQRVSSVCRKIDAMRNRLDSLTKLVAGMYEGNGHGDPREILQNSEGEELLEDILEEEQS